VLIAKEEKLKEITKENEEETEMLNPIQTVEEVQKIFDNWKNIMMINRKRKEEILEQIFDKLKNGSTSLQISKEFTEYYNGNKSNIHFYENYFSNLKYKSLEEEKEENNQKKERKLKRQRDSDDDHDNEE
jgi:hypothetical protein